MSWAGFFLGTNQPGWFARMDLPLEISRCSQFTGTRRPPTELRGSW
jgi:hypothetical protein